MDRSNTAEAFSHESGMCTACKREFDAWKASGEPVKPDAGFLGIFKKPRKVSLQEELELLVNKSSITAVVWWMLHEVETTVSIRNTVAGDVKLLNYLQLAYRRAGLVPGSDGVVPYDSKANRAIFASIIKGQTWAECLHTLNEVCTMKAEHFSQRYQNDNLADAWVLVGAACMTAAQYAQKQGK